MRISGSGVPQCRALRGKGTPDGNEESDAILSVLALDA